jgi:hypothetical protein
VAKQRSVRNNHTGQHPAFWRVEWLEASADKRFPIYLGCQWKELPIDKDGEGRPEIHHTRIYSAWRRWEAAGCIDVILPVW